MSDHDILSNPLSSLQISDLTQAAPKDPTATAPRETTKPIINTHEQAENDEDTVLLSEREKNENVIEVIRSRLASTESKHSLRIDCCAKILAETPMTSPIDSPVCKGGEWSIASNIAPILLGHCKYFIAPLEIQAGKEEHQVFSISLDKHLVSHVNADTDCYTDDLVVKVREDYPALCFGIGGRMYFWSAQEYRLDWIPLCGDINYQPHSTALYDQLDDARREIQHIGHTGGSQHNQAGAYPFVEAQPDSFSTPSPPNTADYPQPDSWSTSSRELKFGEHAQKEDIDDWVDKAAATRQLCTRDGRIECPESGCSSSSRRPHALKDHLYTHYDIRPFNCNFKSCTKAFATQANMIRHFNNIHVCAGCREVLSSDDSKRHKKTCIKLIYDPPAARGSMAWS